jgi:hypothetical protein
MKNRILGASYERAVELVAAGCPIDYLDALPRQSFRAEQIAGYVGNRVYAFGPRDTGYVIAIRLGTDRPSGTVIKDWSFELSGPDHFIFWDYKPEDIIPKKYRDDYSGLLKPRLMKVLNEGRKIPRGYPVEGVLCGRSFQPIEESSLGVISAKLSFTDDLGNTIGLCIELDLYRLSRSSANRRPVRKAGGLLSRRHVEFERGPDFARPIEALIGGKQAQTQKLSGWMHSRSTQEAP